jgi:hypothetical protein
MSAYQVSRLQYNRLMQVQNRWLPWRFISKTRLVTLSLIGIILCLTFNTISTALENRAPVIENSVEPTLHNGWVTLVIDRTRKNFCEVKPSRIVFQDFSIDGKQHIPFIIPVNSNSFVWPYLGRQIIGLALIQEKELTPGPWQIVVTQNENCNWLDWIAGGRQFTTKPVTINIPSLALTDGQDGQ